MDMRYTFLYINKHGNFIAKKIDENPILWVYSHENKKIKKYSLHLIRYFKILLKLDGMIFIDKCKIINI